MSVVWFERNNLIPNVIKELRNADIVLDIGCGIMPEPYITPKVHICCEPYTQYLEVLQERISEKTDVYYVLLNLTWEDVIKIFLPRSVDTVFLVDVIEHEEKEKALHLLRGTEEIARQQIVLFTPLGFMLQEQAGGQDSWNLGGGAWQKHKSGWLPEDFGDDWRIYACEDFHEHDSNGNRLDKPFGALWAIKDAEKETQRGSRISEGIPKSVWMKFQSLLEDHEILKEDHENLRLEYERLQREYQKIRQQKLVRVATKLRLLRE
jgi:hypothetical protein